MSSIGAKNRSGRPLDAGVALLLVLAAAGVGCTFGDGGGYARLSGRLTCTFAGLDSAAGRLTSDGWYRTDQTFEVKLSALKLTARDLRLVGSAGGGSAAATGGCTFDPADPPAGCSLCHNDHCHCDGKLVSYAQLKAQACGGSGEAGGVTTLARLLVGGAADLLAAGGGAAPADLACAPSCELPRGQADGARVVLDRLVVQGSLRDGSAQARLGGAVLKLDLLAELAGATLSHTFSPAQVMARDQPYRLDLAAALPVSAQLLDGLLFHKLTQSGGQITISAKDNSAALEQVATNLALSKLAATVKRFD